MDKYSEYRKLDKKEKEKRIKKAEQSEQNRRPNPQGICQFHELNPFHFEVQDGKKSLCLHTYRHNPSTVDPIGVIFMFHGLNSYIGHGAHLAEYFGERGFFTVGFDHRGFGRSEGTGGYAEGLETHLKDAKAFLKEVMPKYEKLPKFALGLSMGGMTAYHLTLEDPNLFDGVILMAPALKNIVGGFLLGTTATLQKILPKKAKLFKPPFGKASRNPAVTEWAKNDKYYFAERASLSTLSMILSTMDKSPATFKNYKAPFIIFQGGLDKLVNPEVAFELYDQSLTPQQDKQIHFYENMWHDVWHEQEINQIMKITEEWMLKRIKKKYQKESMDHDKEQKD